MLIHQLSLINKAYDSKTLRGLPDKKNPLDRVNRILALLKFILNNHSVFDRDKLPVFLDVFSFVLTPQAKHLLKVKLLTIQN